LGNAHRSEVSASLRHLKLFESVARLRSVRKASEECHLSQPAVTQAIAKLEEQTGVTLLDRRASGTYANEFGTIFQRRTQRLFDQIERALVALGVPNSHAPIPLVASRITRSQIRSLTAIVENGSFAQAARALGVSQTSLQRAARDLERTLRMPLFIQTARAIKVAMREMEAALDELEAARGNFGGKIVIGAMLLTGSVVLASVLQEFMAAYPNANVHVWSGTAEDTMKYLRAGDLDVVIGLLREPPLEDLVGVALAETPFVVVGRKNHPLAKKRAVTLSDIGKYEWIVGTPGATRRARFDGLFPEQRRPKARLATCSLPIIRLSLAQSDSLTLLTSYELLHEEDALTAIDFGPIEPVPSIGLAVRENWLPTQLQTNFLDLVKRRIVGSLTPRKELKRAS